MKRIIFATIALHFVLGMNAMAQATNLNQLSKPERDSILITVAKEAMLKYAPDWYREDIVPTIEFKGYSKREENKHRQFYFVTYYIDKAKDPDNWDYMGRIYVWEDTGKVSTVALGNGGMFLDLDKAMETRSNISPQTPPYRHAADNPYKGMKASDVWPELLNK